jgi:hypothetical protein
MPEPKCIFMEDAGYVFWSRALIKSLQPSSLIWVLRYPAKLPSRANGSGKVIGPKDVKSDIVMLRAPDGQVSIELAESFEN